MAFYTGRSGSLKVGSPGKVVAKIRDWSLESTVELLSTNSIDSSFNTFTPGVRGATGSATLLLYRLEGEKRATYTDAFTLLKDSNIMSGYSAEESDLLRFELNAGPDVRDDIIFNAYITSASMSVSTGELSTVSINFTVHDAISNTFAAT